MQDIMWRDADPDIDLPGEAELAFYNLPCSSFKRRRINQRTSYAIYKSIVQATLPTIVQHETARLRYKVLHRAIRMNGYASKLREIKTDLYQTKRRNG